MSGEIAANSLLLFSAAPFPRGDGRAGIEGGGERGLAVEEEAEGRGEKREMSEKSRVHVPRFCRLKGVQNNSMKMGCSGFIGDFEHAI